MKEFNNSEFKSKFKVIFNEEEKIEPLNKKITREIDNKGLRYSESTLISKYYRKIIKNDLKIRFIDKDEENKFITMINSVSKYALVGIKFNLTYELISDENMIYYLYVEFISLPPHDDYRD